MATEIDALVVRIEADLNQLKRELSGAQRATTKAGGRMSRAFVGLNRQLGRVQKSVFSLKGVIVGVVTGAVVRQTIKLSDTYKLLRGRMRLVTESTDQLNLVQAKLFDLSQETRGSFEGTIDLYTRLARGTDELGATQNELLEVTKTINKAIAVSGATSQEAASGLIQLGQGLAAGALRGDELNSVMEQLPRLALAIADGMGKTIGELRALGAEGALSGKVVFEALLQQGVVLAAEFSQLERTVGNAFQQLQNSLLRAIGEMDTATESGKELAGAIDEIREIVESPDFQNALVATARGIKEAFQFLIEHGDTIIATLVAIKAAGIGAAVGGRVGGSLGAILGGGLAGTGAFVAVSKGLDSLGTDSANASGELDLTTLSLEQLNERLEITNSILNQLKTSNLSDLSPEITEFLSGVEGATPGARRAQGIGLLQREQTRIQSTITTQESLDKRGTPAVKADPDAAKATIKAKDKLAELVSELEREAEVLGIIEPLRDRRRLLLEAEAIALEGGIELSDAWRKAIEQAADKVNEAARADEELTKAQDQLTEIMEEGVAVTEAVTTAAETYADTMFRLDLLLREGAISQETFNRAAVEATEVMEETTEASKAVKEAATELGFTFSSAFEDAIIEGNNLRDVLAGLEQDILRVLARKLVTEPLSNALEDLLLSVGGSLTGLIPGAGAGAGTASGFASGTRPFGGIGLIHGGGKITGSSGHTPRLGNIPQYNTGGVVGFQPRLNPNEVLAVLERGETVRNQRQEAELRGIGGGSIQVSQTFILPEDTSVGPQETAQQVGATVVSSLQQLARDM